MYFTKDLRLERGKDSFSSSRMFCSELDLAQPFLNSKRKLIVFKFSLQAGAPVTWGHLFVVFTTHKHLSRSESSAITHGQAPPSNITDSGRSKEEPLLYMAWWAPKNFAPAPYRSSH